MPNRLSDFQAIQQLITQSLSPQRRAKLDQMRLQQMFQRWAGINANEFWHSISPDNIKQLLEQQRLTPQRTAATVAAKLPQLRLTINCITAAEYANHGEQLTINYAFYQSIFGNILLASTSKGICYLAFADQPELALAELKAMFIKARYQLQTAAIHLTALQALKPFNQQPLELSLDLKGSCFQLKVWQQLLQTNFAQLTCYSQLARQLQLPQAARAVGNAVAKNPISYLIPCHRVIQANGKFGNYRWQSSRKIAMLGWEITQLKQSQQLLLN